MLKYMCTVSKAPTLSMRTLFYTKKERRRRMGSFRVLQGPMAFSWRVMEKLGRIGEGMSREVASRASLC